MAGEINIPITGDARDFIKATGNVEDALEDVADALDDMTRDTKKGADKAEDAVDDLADKFDDARKAAKKLGDAGDDAGRDVKKGMDKADDGLKDFKQEAESTAKESAASFDGSAESIADAFQEVAANAFAGFGPAGAVAGIAAAAGIGMVIAGFEAADEAAKESAERASEWADAYIEAGGRVLTFDQTMAKILDITSNKYDEATTNAENWGVSIETAIAAMAGSTSALDEVTRSVDKQTEAAAEGAVKIADGGEALADMLVGTSAKAREGKDALNLLTGEMDKGATQASIYTRLLIDTARATEGATEKTDEFGDTIITLPDGKQVYIDAETGAATEDVDAIERKIYGIPDGSASVSVDTWQAQRDADNFIASNDGRSFTIYGRTVTSGFGSVEP